ncbi:MAG: ATP-dependent Clp protease ATP-binding subunit [Lachnospiraceae bacterium]|nr:ATP-dependent Clp protease ATP-binding subunit [Lachnospiraceae bacterium]
MGKLYTEQAERVLAYAEQAAEHLSHGYIGSEHLLVALLREDCVAKEVLQGNGVKAEKLDELIAQLITPQGKSRKKKPQNTPRLLRILEQAEQEAEHYNSEKVGTEHLLLALLQEADCIAVRLLNTLGIQGQKIYFGTLEAMGIDSTRAKADYAMSRSRMKKAEGGNGALLEKYSKDLTEIAAKGKLDPVIGREEEIGRVIRILSRRTKNNPCLVGEPGVGKTAVVEGLATRIARGDVPENMKKKRVLSLDLSGMVAGSKYRGEFEERIKRVMEEAIADGNVLIFIDELHTIIGAGGAEGALDASNIMKPALARGEFQVIGATTREEYRKHIEKDAALERRFQPVVVEEPSLAEAEDILFGLRATYETHHGIKISDDAVKAAVRLSERYINDRFLPDKAIDVLDEAASMVRLSELTGKEALSEKKQQLEKLEQEKEALLLSGDAEGAIALAAKQKRLKNRIAAEEAAENKVLTLSEQAVADVISAWTKIPLQKLCEEESERLLKLPEVLRKRVIGQEDAVMAVSRAIRRARVGLQNPDRPIGSFLFLGPTGVGKTELSKALAEAVFGKEDAMIRVDMSEYMEKHSVSKMIGSPPVYVGHEEGGQLSEQIRRTPYSVVLFDELEKAHPDVFNILLQVLEDGHITDAQGRKVSFKNTIIIMTSNTGAQGIMSPKNLGFLSAPDAGADYERMRARVMEEVKQSFKPEFLNRIDETIVFRTLGAEAMKEIAKLQIATVVKRCKEQLDITLKPEDAVAEFIVKKGSDEKYGARPIRRAVQVHIEDKLAEEILAGTVETGDMVALSVKDAESPETAQITVRRVRRKRNVKKS